METGLLRTHVTTRRRKKRENVSYKENYVFSRDRRKTPSSVEKNKSGKHATLLSAFLAATRSTRFKTYWEEDTALASLVIKASMSQNIHTGSEGCVRLSGETKEILSMSRQLVKDAAESNDDKRAVDNIHVAVHLLRAVAGYLSSSSRRESGIKLLYHCLAALEKRICFTGDCSAILFLGLVSEAYSCIGSILHTTKARVRGLGVTFALKRLQGLFVPIDVVFPSAVEQAPDSTAMMFQSVTSTVMYSTFSLARMMVAMSFWNVTMTRFTATENGTLCGIEDTGLIQAWGGSLRKDVSALLENLVIWVSSPGRLNIPDGCCGDHSLYSKTAHKILWTAASDLAKNSNTGQECLELRKVGVLIFLHGAQGRSSPEKAEEITKTACTYAWKAAVSFVALANNEFCDKQSVLYRYHEDIVGSMQGYLNQDSLDFVEYCVYRSLHLSMPGQRCRPNTLMMWLPHHEETKSSTWLRALRELFEAIAVVRYYLVSGCGTIDKEPGAIFKMVKNASENFHKDSLSVCLVDLNKHTRVLRLLKAARLARCVCESLKHGRLVSEEILNASFHLLSVGVGSVVYKMGTIPSVHGTVSQQCIELATDCFVQGVSVVEEGRTLGQGVSVDHLKRTDNCIWYLLEILMDLTNDNHCPSTEMLHRVAKTLQFYGKRSGAEKNSCQLILASIALCIFLQEKCGVAYDVLQIESQWTLLAAKYKELGCIEASILAMSFAILYSLFEIAEASSFDTEEASEVLVHASACHFPLYLQGPSETQSGCRRTIDLLDRFLSMVFESNVPLKGEDDGDVQNEMFSTQCAVNVLRTGQDPGSIRNQFFCTTGGQFSLVGIVNAVVRKAVFVNQDSKSWCALLKSAIVCLSHTIFRVGSSFKWPDGSPSVFGSKDHLLEWAFDFVDVLQSSSIAYVQEDLVKALLLVSSSFSWLSCHPFVRRRTRMMSPFPVKTPLFDPNFRAQVERDANSIESAMSLMKRAREDQKNCWGDFASQLFPVLLILKRDVLQVLLDNETNKVGIPLLFLAGHINPAEALDSKKSLLLDCSAASIRSQLSDRFNLSGHFVLASTFSNPGQRILIRHWFEARTATALVQGCVSKIQKPTKHTEDIFSWENRLCRLYCAFRDSHEHERDKQRQILLLITELLGTIDKLLDESEVVSESLLLRWARSLGKLFRAYVHTTLGLMMKAIEDFGSSVTDCRKIEELLLQLSEGRYKVSGSSFGMFVMRSLGSGCYGRQLTCLTELSNLYSNIGDWRRANSYLDAALDLLRYQHTSATHVDPVQFNCAPRYMQLDIQRKLLIARKNPSVSPVPWLMAEESQEGGLHGDEFFDEKVQSIVQMMEHFGDSGSENRISETVDTAWAGLREDSRAKLLIKDAGIGDLDDNTISKVFGMRYIMKLRDILRTLGQGTGIQNEAIPEIERLVHEVSTCPGVPPNAVMEALYLAGSIFLRMAQADGGIRSLWSGYSNLPGSGQPSDVHKQWLSKSARLLERAIKLAGQSTNGLTRDMLRSLALVVGPGGKDQKRSRFVNFLIQASISRAWRTQACENHSVKSESAVFSLFDDIDKETVSRMYGSLLNLAPAEWRFVSAAICPSGEMLLSSFENGSASAVCIFPVEADSIQSELIDPICCVIAACQAQLSEPTVQIQDKEDNHQMRRKWWEERKSYDTELERRIALLQQRLAESGSAVRSVLFGRSSELFCGNLSNRLDSAAEEGNGSVDQECTFIILDENLQKIPFESMEPFAGVAVCRLPCISFALHQLRLRKGPRSVSTDKVSLVLDPESNLNGTKLRLMPVLESIGSAHWKHTVQCRPSKKFFENALSDEQGLLLYFGHGGGEKYFSGRDLRSFCAENPDIARKGGVVLMGCSSCRLQPGGEPWRYDADSKAFYEPDGIAYSYLAAGASFVVGNLWDVTDQDIDRFSVALLADFLGNGKGSSIAVALSNARGACRLSSVVGFAPVCYGLPSTATSTSVN